VTSASSAPRQHAARARRFLPRRKIWQADLREIDRKIEATAISFVAFKLHVAELHPTAVELSASLDRLSSRIHRLPERDGR
jgi:hypothetical protein